MGIKMSLYIMILTVLHLFASEAAYALRCNGEAISEVSNFSGKWSVVLYKDCELNLYDPSLCTDYTFLEPSPSITFQKWIVDFADNSLSIYEEQSFSKDIKPLNIISCIYDANNQGNLIIVFSVEEVIYNNEQELSSKTTTQYKFKLLLPNQIEGTWTSNSLNIDNILGHIKSNESGTIEMIRINKER